MNNPHLQRETTGTAVTLRCRGSWTLYTLDRIEKEFAALKIDPQTRRILVDFGGVEEFDSSGILFLDEIRHRLSERNLPVELAGLDQKQRRMLELIDRGYGHGPLPKRRENIFHRIGKATLDELSVVRDFFTFIGELSVSVVRLLRHPGNFRIRESVYHIEKSGFDALFIIALTSILVGLVIAYQSIVQLAKFGADIFVVDATGIAITRELGPMLTAIVIAGRSASSYAAEIGTMKITEEISAMRTMGFDPFYFLVIPRIVALMIALPLLIFFSDLTGILGGMIATKAQVDISFSFFLQRLQEVLEVKHYVLGIVKGPFFAFIIAATGCFHGFRVTKDTESIGIETTASVVHAIFFVIACDALFSVVYTELGL